MTTSNETTRTVLMREVGTLEKPLSIISSNVCVVQKKQTLHLRDDGITVTTSELTTGLATSGKRWYRWVRVKGYTADFRGRGKGPRRIFLYHYNSWFGTGSIRVSSFSDRSGFSGVWQEFFDFSPVVYEEFEKRVEKFFPYLLPRVSRQNPNKGMFGVLCAYPALNDFTGLYSTTSEWFRVQTLYGLQRGLREETATQCVQKSFGKTRSNRRLVRTLTQSIEQPAVALATHFRGKVPTDWISDAVSAVVGNQHLPSVQYDEIRRMLDRILDCIPEGRKRVFFLSIFSSVNSRDTLRLMTWNGNIQVEELTLDVRTMDELHERCIQHGRRQRTAVRRDDRSIAVEGISAKYHNIEIEGGLSCVAPTTAADLITWSSVLENCIEGYATPAVGQELFLGAVFEGETLLANFEINPDGHLMQLLGKKNAELTENKRNAIIDALASVKAIHLDTVEDAWGVPSYTPINERKLIEA